MNIPIVRLELEHMKFGIVQALNKHVLNIDAEVQKAIDEFATEQNLSAIVRNITHQEIRAAVNDEIQRFFRYSDKGRAAIREAVNEHLNREFPKAES